ncbi:glycosyltransferase family 2 protein [Mangrovicoccus ximenensis]|uniref:glycosyltransferase family 2 protein n=1 Tax=Mangrovicoccus ximenensis TaxID=1911570 RepID=UPI001F352FA6|nr:glycosyltransferase family A protein [Mangrovicoccus ximenensis]
MPEASIVVPAYNAAATLRETLESLLAQTHPDFEIVVVDDGSTDCSAAIARSFGDRRIRLVQQRNRGLAGARNSGIAAARGRYVGFCDADDLWRPGKLAAHAAHLAANPQVGLSFSGSELIDGAGRTLRVAQKPRLTGITAAHVYRRNPVGNGSAPVMRREALDDIPARPGWRRAGAGLRRRFRPAAPPRCGPRGRRCRVASRHRPWLSARWSFFASLSFERSAGGGERRGQAASRSAAGDRYFCEAATSASSASPPASVTGPVSIINRAAATSPAFSGQLAGRSR